MSRTSGYCLERSHIPGPLKSNRNAFSTGGGPWLPHCRARPEQGQAGQGLPTRRRDGSVLRPSFHPFPQGACGKPPEERGHNMAAGTSAPLRANKRAAGSSHKASVAGLPTDEGRGRAGGAPSGRPFVLPQEGGLPSARRLRSKSPVTARRLALPERGDRPQGPHTSSPLGGRAPDSSASLVPRQRPGPAAGRVPPAEARGPPRSHAVLAPRPPLSADCRLPLPGRPGKGSRSLGFLGGPEAEESSPARLRLPPPFCTTRQEAAPGAAAILEGSARRIHSPSPRTQQLPPQLPPLDPVVGDREGRGKGNGKQKRGREGGGRSRGWPETLSSEESPLQPPPGTRRRLHRAPARCWRRGVSEAQLITPGRPPHRSLPEWLLCCPISSRASVRHQSAHGGGEEPPSKLGCGAAPPQCAKPYSRRLWGQASGVRAAGRRAAGILRSAGSPGSVRLWAVASPRAGALFWRPNLTLASKSSFLSSP